MVFVLCAYSFFLFFCFHWKPFCIVLVGIWRYHHKKDWPSSSFWHLWRTCDTRTVQHGCWEAGGLPYWAGPVGQGQSSFECFLWGSHCFLFSFLPFWFRFRVCIFIEILELAVKSLQTITMWELRHLFCFKVVWIALPLYSIDFCVILLDFCGLSSSSLFTIMFRVVVSLMKWSFIVVIQHLKVYTKVVIVPRCYRESTEHVGITTNLTVWIVRLIQII